MSALSITAYFIFCLPGRNGQFCCYRLTTIYFVILWLLEERDFLVYFFYIHLLKEWGWTEEGLSHTFSSVPSPSRHLSLPKKSAQAVNVKNRDWVVQQYKELQCWILFSWQALARMALFYLLHRLIPHFSINFPQAEKKKIIAVVWMS